MLKVSLLKPLKALLVLGFISLAYGCTTTQSKNQSSVESPSKGAILTYYQNDQQPATQTATQVKAELNGPLVFYLLSAELAGQRNNLDYALEVYSALALQTQHPLIAERTSWIAQFAQQPKAALDAAILWATLAPQNPDAQRTAAGLLLQNEQYLDAFDHLLNFEKLSGESNYTLLATHLSEKNNPVISDLYQKMLEEKQRREEASSDLETALALLSDELGRQPTSRQHLKSALAINPNNVRALQLKAELLRSQGDYSQAEKLLNQALKNKPEEVRLWLEVARTQLKSGKLSQAEQTFDHIINLQPDNLPIRLALARIQIETEQYTAAKQTLKDLTDFDLLADQSWLLLGQLAERDQQWQLALQHYNQVTSGDPLVLATQASVRLLVENNQAPTALGLIQEKRSQAPELSVPLTLLGESLLRQQKDFAAALSWVDSGRDLLAENQESTQLLYARALLNYHLDDLNQMEADLNHLLSIDPNNAVALNALGYTLVDKTERINEGLLLIQKAHALDSESAEILDSLGWALFKLGRYEEALEYLEEAYARLQESEIAEHLIQVFWKLEKNEQAETLLNNYPELNLQPNQ
ncbi:tetratricopeptide repeat protein [Marinospirillum insulare]|uniref:Tetratricopeptide repeat protein n=1 Tax=Marinospirillum insulare TaxID=217169 RepID=A0ABQ5ZX44_9GAMM|nr:tetratricopeptide repeat protein [Marinospirillum insulare]GLR64749.1 hypothetical protein GCM10007878_21870 [Marinospirillum insulare]